MVLIVSPEQFTALGLEMLRHASVEKTKEDLSHFVAHFGSKPTVVSKLYEAIQTTSTESANLVRRKITARTFLIGLHFLRCYPTEPLMVVRFGHSAKTCRKYVWMVARRIQALKKTKVSTEGDCRSALFIASCKPILATKRHSIQYSNFLPLLLFVPLSTPMNSRLCGQQAGRLILFMTVSRHSLCLSMAHTSKSTSRQLVQRQRTQSTTVISFSSLLSTTSWLYQSMSRSLCGLMVPFLQVAMT